MYIVFMGIMFLFVLYLSISSVLHRRRFCSICGTKLCFAKIDQRLKCISSKIKFFLGKPTVVDKFYSDVLDYAHFCPKNISHYYKEIIKNPDGYC